MGEPGSSRLPGAVRQACETRTHLGGLEGGVYRGHEGVRRWFNDVYSDWTEFCPELRTFDELGDSLLVEGRIRARGRVSGVELDTAIWWRCSFATGESCAWMRSESPATLTARPSLGVADAAT